MLSDNGEPRATATHIVDHEIPGVSGKLRLLTIEQRRRLVAKLCAMVYPSINLKKAVEHVFVPLIRSTTAA